MGKKELTGLLVVSKDKNICLREKDFIPQAESSDGDGLLFSRRFYAGLLAGGIFWVIIISLMVWSMG